MASKKIIGLFLVASLIYISEVTSCPSRDFITKHICLGDVTNTQGCARASSRLRNTADWARGGIFRKKGVEYVKLSIFTTTTSVGQSSQYTTKKPDRNERNQVVNACTASESEKPNPKCCLFKETLRKYDCETARSNLKNGQDSDWTCTFMGAVHPLHGLKTGHYFGDAS